MMGERRLQPRRRPEMVEEVGVRLADLRAHRLQGYRLRTGLDQQPPRRLQRGGAALLGGKAFTRRSEEHTSELQSLMRISYAVFCLKKKKATNNRRKNQYK